MKTSFLIDVIFSLALGVHSKSSANFKFTLPAGGATGGAGKTGGARSHFNPRSPRGGATIFILAVVRGDRHFNPRSPRGERQKRVYGSLQKVSISIHAPRGGSDVGASTLWSEIQSVFQSTLPAGGATTTECLCAPQGSRHFNPRSPRGERPWPFVRWSSHLYFNPRSPRGERHGNSTSGPF